jgi:hypothetical protein
MQNKSSLLGGAALGVLLAFGACAVAQAAPESQAAANAELKSEVEQLKADVQALEAWKDSQVAAHQDDQAKLQQMQAQLDDANARAAQAEAQAQAQIQTIPTEVATEVAKDKPKTDKIYYKGVTITVGGFAAAEGVYRSKNNVADIGSNYSKIPYFNNVMSHTDELRGTARQSRLSILAQGNINPTTVAAFYGEFDFLGAAQTANSNESNSYQPRIRNVYGTVDWNDLGVEVLAGQNWSLATLNSKGITPRNEVPPATIEAQYVPGFVWARQPQIRLVKSFDKQVWLAVSLESPATTFASAATGVSGTASGVSITDTAVGVSQLNSANSYSFNHLPDVIGKVAWEPMIGGAQPLHMEAFGIYRQYYDRVNSAAGNAALNPVGITNVNTTGGGFGGSVTFSVIPKVLDLQGSAMTGTGIGRYGSGQLPDTVVASNGSLQPIPETMFLFGGTLHATPALDIYVYGGEEYEGSKVFTVGANTSFGGYGNPTANMTNCFIEGASCTANTRQIDQYTAGFWDKVYNGSYGNVRVGLQYSHTDLIAFAGTGGRPTTSDDMVFTSFRYYPF